MAKTLRVHTLAKELGVASKDLIAKCHAEGIELKNHMAAISVGLAESIREWFSVSEDVTSVEVAQPVDLKKVRKPRKKKAKAAEAETDQEQVATAVEEAPPDVAVAVAEAPEVALEPVTVTTAEPAVVEPPAAPETTPAEVAAEAEVEVAEPAPAAVPEAEEAAATEVEEPPGEAEQQIAAAAEESKPEEPEQPVAEPPKPEPPPELIKPAGPQVVPTPAELKGPRVVRIESPEPVTRRRPRPARPAASMGQVADAQVGAPAQRGRGKGGRASEEEERRRARSRSPRRHGRGADVGERIKEWRDQDLLERKERLASATGHGLRERRAAERRRKASAAGTAIPSVRKTQVELSEPIIVKDFCAAVGQPFSWVLTKLLEHTGVPKTVNQTIDADTAELLGLDLGITISVARAKTAYERLKDEFATRERQSLEHRPPVVAMLGHVDHGKTSLLDAIRKTDVVAGEAGGITQHIGAYRIDRGSWSVSFLDTPGHEAFTAMRARGADLTDVVVLVVAADDGIMPQTVEAINHAKAAGVQIVVALNKIDLQNVDLNKVYSQLAEHGLAPGEWGGETDLIKTSATTGEGIDELIEHLSTLSELMDLKADSTVPAHATVIEAQMRAGQGVVAQVLVREGTLRKGQVVVCGGGAGRIRTLRDHNGKQLKQAGPGTPVEVAGLDALPEAGDGLFEVDSLPRAKEIAVETRERRHEESLRSTGKPSTLEELLAGSEESEVPELKIIIKADVQGSLDALKTKLREFPSDKARLTTLHAGVGAISEADVRLAQASDAIIIGFHIVAEDRARRLADQVGVEIRLYRVIYEIIEDMYKGLAGLLEPVQQEEARGSAEVRQIFRISRVGTVAGCLVSDGTIQRNHKVRLVRDGRVVLEKGAIASLRRVKDDVREVRAGLECGIRIEGFDDVKPGDVIEAYETVEVAQEL